MAPETKKQQAPNRDPVIHVDPPELVQKVPLGAKYRARYNVDDLRAGSRVAWHHTLSSVGKSRQIDHVGPSSEVAEQIGTAGTRELDTHAEIDGRRESLPSTTLNTPHCPTNIIAMHGVAVDRGKNPTLKAIQQSEKLIVDVELPEIDEELEQVDAMFVGSGLVDVGCRKIGVKQFAAVLAPIAGETFGRGSLYVVPRGVRTSNSITPARLDLQIEAAAENQDRFGSRPATTAIAVSTAIRKWGDLYAQRLRAVDMLMNQIAVVDPAPPTPLWERFLGAALKIALNAVTAGLGAGIVSVLGESKSALAEGGKEFLKVLIEQNTSTAIEEGIAHARSEEDASSGGRRTEGGTLLSPKNYFQRGQQKALEDMKDDHLIRVESTLTSMTTRLDREHPGAGYLAAIRANDAFVTQHQNAWDLQFAASLQAYCVFIAKARLGVGQATHGRDPGTELASQVSVHKIIGRGGTGTGTLDQTPGVLRMELVETAPGAFAVARSFIAGFEGDTIVGNLAREIRDLHIPIVARFNQTTERGFVISRNENGAVLAHSSNGLMQEMFGGKHDHEAARLIFDQIGPLKIKPERG